MKKWFDHKIGGQTWNIYLVSPNSKHLKLSGNHLYGMCHYDACRIYISNGLATGLREDTVLHELTHAWLRVSGADEAYGANYELDELLVTRLTPILHRSLSDLGFTLPPLP